MTRFYQNFLLFAVSLPAIIACCSQNSTTDKTPSIPADRELESKVEKTLKSLSTKEKAGQMIQLTLDTITGFGQDLNEEAMDVVFGQYKIGSILNVASYAPTTKKMEEMMRLIQEKSMKHIGVPCLYGLDMIHGTTYYAEGTFFPQEVNLAATFQPEYARQMGRVIGYETRAGLVPWVFSPVMDLTRNAAWSRNWESYGEDPYLQSVMASTETRAIQGEDPNHIDKYHCAVSIKHFMGYGATTSGKDRTPAVIPDNVLREKFFAPFKACVRAGALTVMVNSASINDVPTHANTKLLTGWLKEGLNWDGMIVTDWADANNLYQRDFVAADKKDALCLCINAGIDMIMEPYDPTAVDLICELVEEGRISKARLDDAARRILRVKYRLGLFDNPVWETGDYDEYGCAEFRQASLDAAAESLVLLKNENVLPLKPGARILLTGPNANSMRALNGGWSYTWQGSGTERYTDGFNTILEALQGKFGSVRYVPGVVYDEAGNWADDRIVDIAAAVRAAREADVVIACIGENSYCETPGNVDDITLSANQARLVQALEETGKPVVLVVGGGRPRIIRDLEPRAAAVVDIMLPGNFGADALAELLCGERNFSGRMPFTYPKYTNSLHTYDYKVTENVSTMGGMYNYDAVMDVQWPFGYGLSYTSFEYSNLVAEKTSFGAADELRFSVDVRNTGSVAGKEAVLLYSSDLIASIIPDVRRLRAFTKIELQPGESRTVTLSVPASSLAFVGADGLWTLEEGDFRISVGGRSCNVTCTETKVWKEQNID